MSAREHDLYALAETQQGYFTTAQAVACGYPTSNHGYHLKAGGWKRVHRGIYRLVRFPQSADEQYVLWSLWSRNRQGIPQGVYSHQTALTLFELSDVMPARLHMTVPPGFRRSAAIPDVLALHRDVIASNDVESHHGYSVTRPLRTLSDLLKEGRLSMDHLRLAACQALARGLVTRSEVEAHPAAPALKKLLENGSP